MVSFQSFLKSHNLKISQKDQLFLKKYWNNDKKFKTKFWYTQIFEQLGEGGTIELAEIVIKGNYDVYKNFIGKKKHVDIGSGSGVASLCIRENTEIPVEMIDIYDGDVSSVVRRRIAKDKFFNLTIYKSGNKLPFQDKSFDSASLFYVLHHCNSRLEAKNLLKEAWRLLEDDSHLIIVEELISKLEEKQRLDNIDQIVNEFFMPQGYKESFAGSKFYTKQEIESNFRDAKFEIVKCIDKAIWEWLVPRTIYILKKQN